MSNNISITSTVTGVGGAGTNAYSNVGAGSISSLGLTRSPSTVNGEDMFEFLKENIRVAEYVDDNNKLLYVELQMRAGPGFVWDKIRRVRLKETDDML